MLALIYILARLQKKLEILIYEYHSIILHDLGKLPIYTVLADRR